MAKTTDRDLFDKLRARGLRKDAASNLAKAFGRADKSPPGKGARRAVSELRDLLSQLEQRVGVGGGSTSAKRSAAGKKAAATRKRKANERSRAAKKAAQTRAKSSSSRRTSSRGRSTRAKAKSK
jgi:hypothetical protein